VNWYLGLWWSMWRISQLGRLNFMPHSMAQPAILPCPHLLSCPGHFQIWSNEIYWPVFIRIPDTGYLTVVILFLTGLFLPVENLISLTRVAPLFTPRVVSLFGFIFLRFFQILLIYFPFSFSLSLPSYSFHISPFFITPLLSGECGGFFSDIRNYGYLAVVVPSTARRFVILKLEAAGAGLGAGRRRSVRIGTAAGPRLSRHRPPRERQQRTSAQVENRTYIVTVHTVS
jgi:hypothetical protein